MRRSSSDPCANLLPSSCGLLAGSLPVEWTQLVRTSGQEEPISNAWLQDDQARIAHSLELPAAVPNPVPFDFERARWRSWLPNVPAVRVQYLNHLCATEAGEWIFKTVKDVKVFISRDRKAPPRVKSSPILMDRKCHGSSDICCSRAIGHPLAKLLANPASHLQLRFVEEPRREVVAGPDPQPYVRLDGYTRKSSSSQAKWFCLESNGAHGSHRHRQLSLVWLDIGAGIVRPRDHENDIAGAKSSS